MPRYLVEGAQLRCTMGTSPARLAVTPSPFPLRVGGASVARVSDITPGANVPPFGMCQSPANPQVAAATAAAMGALTPMPCVPVITAPWSPGATHTTVGGVPAAREDATCACAWAGTVAVDDPAQARMSEGG
ncbi:MAG: DUF4280 domain-containing protein [Polyangiales bacterium]